MVVKLMADGQCWQSRNYIKHINRKFRHFSMQIRVSNYLKRAQKFLQSVMFNLLASSASITLLPILRNQLTALKVRENNTAQASDAFK